MTERYDLEDILLRINEEYELRTKPLQPLALQYSQHQITCLSPWFWQIPHGWSQDIEELEDLKEMVSGQEYGLPLPVPVLVSDGSSGSPEFLMKCGDDLYLFYETSHELLHIDEPSDLRVILSVLGSSDDDDLKVTTVDYLPEYGGPNVVGDSDVSSGWSNRIDKRVSCADLFYKHGIYGSYILLFWHGSVNDSPKYLVEAEYDHYIWDTISNDVWRIGRAQGLQHILDILGDPSRYLTLSLVPTVYRSKTPREVIEEGGLITSSLEYRMAIDGGPGYICKSSLRDALVGVSNRGQSLMGDEFVLKCKTFMRRASKFSVLYLTESKQGREKHACLHLALPPRSKDITAFGGGIMFLFWFMNIGPLSTY